jgi:hypothetical protein
MRRKRTALITLLLLIGLIAVPVVLTWREVRQEQLNHALIAAVDRNDAANVRRLLRHGADPNAEVLPVDTRSVWTRLRDLIRHHPIPSAAPSPFPTWKAVAVHKPVLMEAIEWSPSDKADPDNVDTVKALADAGANVNFRLNYVTMHMLRWDTVPFHTSLLLEAAYHGKVKVVQVLLAHRADANAADDYGRTPLMYAAAQTSPDMVTALLNAGAQIEAKDDDAETALAWIFDYNVWIRHKHAYGLSISIRYDSTMSVYTARRATVAVLLRHRALVNDRDRSGVTILSLAAQCCKEDKELNHMLTQSGASFNRNDNTVPEQLKRLRKKPGSGPRKNIAHQETEME